MGKMKMPFTADERKTLQKINVQVFKINPPTTAAEKEQMAKLLAERARIHNDRRNRAIAMGYHQRPKKVDYVQQS